MDKVSKVKAAPVTTEPRPITEGEAFNLHGQVVTVVSNTSGSVQFYYANGQRRNLQTVRVEHYHSHGAFPKDTLFTRLIDGELVTAKILSVADGEYGLDIQCEDEDIDRGIVSPVKFAEVIKWHMQPEYEETPVAPVVEFKDRPGYVPDEDTPDYAAGVEAGRKAALAEVMEQSQEVSRLTAELKKREGYIDILKHDLDMQRRLVEQLTMDVVSLESRRDILSPSLRLSKTICHDISDDTLTTTADSELNDLVKEGWEVAYEIINSIPLTSAYIDDGLVSSTRKDIRFIRLTRLALEPLPAPQPTYSASVGNPTHGAGQGAPSIIHKDKGERKGVALSHNRPLFEEPGKTKRIPHLQQSNQRVAQFMTGLKERSDERLEILARDFANRSPFKLGVIHHDQSI